jgi:hypothetical protein
MRTEFDHFLDEFTMQTAGFAAGGFAVGLLLRRPMFFTFLGAGIGGGKAYSLAEANFKKIQKDDENLQQS